MRTVETTNFPNQYVSRVKKALPPSPRMYQSEDSSARTATVTIAMSNVPIMTTETLGQGGRISCECDSTTSDDSK